MTKHAERQTVRNAERARIANDAHAGLLVRLHCDVGDGTGFTIYYPARQGTAGGRTGPSQEVMERSCAAALALDSAMAAELSPRWLRDGGILGDSRTFVGSRQGALTGSIFSRGWSRGRTRRRSSASATRCGRGAAPARTGWC